MRARTRLVPALTAHSQCGAVLANSPPSKAARIIAAIPAIGRRHRSVSRAVTKICIHSLLPATSCYQ